MIVNSLAPEREKGKLQTFLVFDPDEKIISSGPGIETFTGFSPDEILNKKLSEIVSGKGQEKTYHIIRQYISSCKQNTVKTLDGISFNTATGEPRQAHLTLMPTPLSPENCMGLITPVDLPPKEADSHNPDLDTAKSLSINAINALIESLPDAIIIVDNRGKIIKTNSRACFLFGYETKDLIGENIEILIPENIRGHHPAYTKEYINHPTSRPIESKEGQLVALKKDGTILPVSISLNPSALGSEKVVIAAIRDISKQKEYVEKLKSLSEIVWYAHEAIIRIDPNGNFQGWNEAASKLFGYTEEEIKKNGLQVLTPKKEIQRTKNIIKKVIDSKSPLSITSKRIKKSGTEIPLRIYIYPLFGEHKEITSLILNFSDISSEIEAEENKRKLTDILNYSSEAIMMYDLKGKIMAWNQGAAEIFGISQEEAIDQNLSKYIPDNEREITQERIAQVKKGKRFKNLVAYRIHKNGNIIAIEYSMYPIKDDQGVVTGIASISRDITDVKNYRERLEQEVNNKTRDLNESLYKLEKSNEELKSFTYASSHDLKSPLRAISHLSSFLEEDLSEHLTDKFREYFRIIHSRVHRMERLIDGILMLSSLQIDKGKYEEIDLKNLISKIQMNLNFERKFEINLPQHLPEIYFDKKLLSLIFENLLSNALKYNNNKTALINISYEKEGVYNVFYVQDNGIGIDAGHISKIFDIFKTISIPQDNDGVGIGLPIVKKIVEETGGQIKVESTPGEGSTFVIYLPV